MGFLENMLSKKDEPIKSNNDFWNWFQKNERTFYKVVRENGNVERDFFNKLSPKLKELKDGFFFLTGMYNETTIELVITADGAIRNIVFVEELIDSAPKIDSWKFTALKPSLDIKDVGIKMDGYDFGKDSLFFYSNNHYDFPDEIDITVIHKDFNEVNKRTITNGTFIFLDTYLGELNFVTTIDSIKVVGRDGAQNELIPIEKLKDFLTWRQKEFVEKYEGIRRNTENDSYSSYTAELQNGNALMAIINTRLLTWDGKASHPWVLTIEIKYSRENNGMPDPETYKLLDDIEQEIMDELKDFDGYLNIGRQTGDGVREIYFACRDFRKPSKVLYKAEQKYSDILGFTYDIYKDKYWQTFKRFTSNA
ncbi:MAG TPA: DUF695 domain-containing protein [Chitinophagales bacterium]|nr:DUF695 domain-containing protein [Chitinophagales bacterium]